MSNNDQDKGSLAESEGPPSADEEQDIEAAENEEAIHERLHRERHHKHTHHQIWTQNREADRHKMHKHNHHHHHHKKHSPNHQPHGHIKEFIKPDPTVRRARSPSSSQATMHIVQLPSKIKSPRPVATAVDEEQLQKRLMESVSEKKQPRPQTVSVQQAREESRSATTTTNRLTDTETRSTSMPPTTATTSSTENKSGSSSSGSGSSQSSSSREGQHHRLLRGADSDKSSSPPPAAIIIPPNVAKSLSSRRPPVVSAPNRTPESPSSFSSNSDLNVPRSPEPQGSMITREQLEYGSLLKSNEVQVLYRSLESIRGKSIASKTIKGQLMKQQPAPDKSQNEKQDS